MSTFEIIGTVGKVETLTSTKGNPYITFTVLDDDRKTFELSLFGDGMSHGKKLKPGAAVVIKGFLGSREFTDKNGKTRFGLETRVQWVEVVEKDEDAKIKIGSVPSEIDAIPF